MEILYNGGSSFSGEPSMQLIAFDRFTARGPDDLAQLSLGELVRALAEKSPADAAAIKVIVLAVLARLNI